MGAIDRNKFKATSVTQMKEADKAVSDSMARGKGNRPGMLDVKPGVNVFRIFPAHPVESGEPNPVSQPSVKVFLPAMVDEKDAAGNLTGNKKLSQKPVFNGRIHGGFEKDLVEEYVKLARAYAENKWGDDPKNKVTKQSYLDKLYGKYIKGNPNSPKGIKYQTAHVMYAKSMNESGQPFGRLELKESVKKKMNELAAMENPTDPLGVDPYSDPTEGRCVIVNYNKDAAQASDYYTTSIDSSYDKVTKQMIFHEISDEELEEFAKQPSLYSMYCNVFTQKDFQLQLEGLAMFDKTNSMGIVSTPEFEQVVEEIGNYFTEEVSDEEIDDTEDTDDEEKDEDGDAFTSMTRPELKQYNKDKKLNILIKTSMSNDDLRNAVRKAAADAVIPHIPLPGEAGYVDDEIEEDAPPVVKVTAKKGSLLDKVKGLK